MRGSGDGNDKDSAGGRDSSHDWDHRSGSDFIDYLELAKSITFDHVKISNDQLFDLRFHTDGQRSHQD